MLYSGNTVKIKEINSISKRKYQHSILDPVDSRRLIIRLNKALQEEKLYLDPELNRTQLAAYIDVSPHHTFHNSLIITSIKVFPSISMSFG